MGSIALVAVALSFLAVGGICGLVSMAILAKSGLNRAVAFGWGASLGPIGLVVAGVLAARRGQATAPVHEADLTW